MTLYQCLKPAIQMATAGVSAAWACVLPLPSNIGLGVICAYTTTIVVRGFMAMDESQKS
jgi:hypothetical protein